MAVVGWCLPFMFAYSCLLWLHLNSIWKFSNWQSHHISLFYNLSRVPANTKKSSLYFWPGLGSNTAQSSSHKPGKQSSWWSDKNGVHEMLIKCWHEHEHMTICISIWFLRSFTILKLKKTTGNETHIYMSFPYLSLLFYLQLDITQTLINNRPPQNYKL